VPDPLITGLGIGPVKGAADVARAIAWSLRASEDPATPPSWLLDGQHRSFKRVVAALRRYRGALLADPVGSGKTYVALAAAASLNPQGATACLVPATLVQQWRSAAAGVGVSVQVTSHEQLSRGRLPQGTRGLVVVDESHHFRNARTRRYAITAPWLVGRPVLLVSATPVVNRLADLSHQLRLGVRDDALAADGVVSLHRAILEGREVSALARIVVEEPGPVGYRPGRSSVLSAPSEDEAVAVAESLARVGGLTLSSQPAIAALVRGVLYRAAGSSPAALLGALRRYRTLLLHARDARTAGRMLGRADLRRFAGETEEQLVFWQLVGGDEGGLDLDLGDLEVLNRVISETAATTSGPDPKRDRLRATLADGRPSLVFVGRRETVRHLRDGLGGRPVAWCTGERAGLGPALVPRETVLSWFGTAELDSDRRALPAPLHLVATDVAAEGLDLQRASRIVHYDSPWTPMRLEQREGRAMRLGSVHPMVEVVRFLPPPALEAAIGVEACLAAKSGLPARAGLGPRAATQWKWRAELGAIVGSGPGAAGVGLVPGGLRGMLAGFTLHAELGAKRECIGAVAGWLGADGVWSEDRDVIMRAMAAAAGSQEPMPVDACRRREALRLLAAPIRNHLSAAAGRRWTGAEPEAAARALAARLRKEVSGAARIRDVRALEHLELALGFVGGGHTAGEAALVRRLADSTDGQLAAALARLPAPTPRPDAIEVLISGVVLFGE